MYTTSKAFIEALVEQDIEFIFANLGSDHPAMLEALSEAKVKGWKIPRLITCPNEMVALSAAHGYAQLTGRAQAVLVHVECGTQALAGAIHNAAKARIPVLIFAGASPFTQEGELIGSRNEFIHWIQDVHDQRGIVRGYMKYDAEVRTGDNIKQQVHRAMQLAYSMPRGPVYLMGAREVMEAECAPCSVDMAHWTPIQPAGLTPTAAGRIAQALAGAKRPLLVTSYLGRNPDAVAQAVRMAHRFGMGIVESVPSYMNYPHDDDYYQGNQFNQPHQNAALAEADVILVVDSDVPWIGAYSKPRSDAVIFHIDIDPLKLQMPLWYVGAAHRHQVEAVLALDQICSIISDEDIDKNAVEEKAEHYRAQSKVRRGKLRAAEVARDTISVPYLLAAVRGQLNDQTIVLNEGITNYHLIYDHLARSRPATMFASGGGSLGWNGGAAIGMKLASQQSEVVAVTGDGSYMFSVPSSVHWMARRYATPFVQIVINNDGWNAPRYSALSVHPDGYASREDDLGLSFAPAPDYAEIAAASGGAWSCKVERASDVESAVAEAFAVMRHEGRSAVLDVVVGR